MEDAVTVLQWTALMTAAFIALSSTDDLFVDVVFWTMKIKRKLFAPSGVNSVDTEALMAKAEQPLAIMVPAWKEAGVIASMVENAVGTLAYRNYTIFIGTYANDQETTAQVDKISARYRQVRHVRLPHDGPTCKADCLNHIVADIRAVEREAGIAFGGLVMHDSEDVLHPLELHMFNYWLPAHDMIQLPVVSLEQRYADLVAGTYMDEFAESHTKDMVVRQRLAGMVPSAGVGTCFSRRAIEMLERDGDPFSTATLTEDYDIGNRLAAHGMSAVMMRYPVEFRTRRGAVLGLGSDRIVTFEMPLCVREHFPNSFSASYRQKARWILGIALQGWEQLGWSKTAVGNYFLLRDRKALITPTLAILAYGLMLTFLALNVGASFTGGDAVPFLPDYPFAMGLVWFNLMALVWRIAQRMYFVWRIYGWGHAVMSIPRSIVLSFINFAASMRAMRIYFSARMTGRSIAWDKTMHRFPSAACLGRERRRLGEILLSWEAVTPPKLERALIDQKIKGGRLGNILICQGAIDEQMLADALAMQEDQARGVDASANAEKTQAYA